MPLNRHRCLKLLSRPEWTKSKKLIFDEFERLLDFVRERKWPCYVLMEVWQGKDGYSGRKGRHVIFDIDLYSLPQD